MKQVFYVYKDKKTGKYLAVDSDGSEISFYSDLLFLTDDFDKVYRAKDLTSNKVHDLLKFRSGLYPNGKLIWNEFGNKPTDSFYPDELEIIIETYSIKLINSAPF